MRNTYIILIILFIPLTLQAQSKAIIKADKYYADFNYSQALKLYKKTEKKGEQQYYVTSKIGDCYRKTGETYKAVEWYKKALDLPNSDHITYLKLAQELKKIKKYHEADQYLKTYYRLSGKNPIINRILNDNYIDLLLKDSMRYEIIPLNINTTYSEFGPRIYEDKIVFSSNRKHIQMVNREDIRDNNYFYKLYEARINDLSNLTDIKRFEKELTSNYNDGPVDFNKDESIAFLTHNIKSKNKSYLNIFIYYKHKNKWGHNASPIPLRQIKFSYMHPFMTANDERLYFVSDMEGGYGGLDIYYSEYKNGFLSPPVNLGPNINTEGNEMFPFISDDGILYFSSDKHAGLGGLDVFFAYPDGNKFSIPFNMGYPINTSYDDFSFILYNNNSGYLASNRPGGKGDDDIYAFKIKTPLRYKRLMGIVKSKSTQKPISDAIIELLNGKQIIASTTTNKDGQFTLYLKTDEENVLEIKKQYYTTVKKTFNTNNLNTLQNNELEIFMTDY